jgi:hypothetical protein
MVGIRLHQDVCIPSCGVKKARQIVSKADCGDSWQWLLENGYGRELTEAEYAEAIASPPPEMADEDVDGDDDDQEDEDVDDDELEGDPESSADAETEKPGAEQSVSPSEGEVDQLPENGSETPVSESLSEDQKSVLQAVKEHLSGGKARLETILLQTGLTEDVVTPVLTEANGFRRNQQGWWGLI